MAGTESASLVVSLLDKVTGPARNASAAIRGIGGAARSVNETLSGRLSAALDANARKLEAMRGRMIEATAAGYGLYRALKAPVEAFTTFESKIEDIAQKLDLPRAQLPRLGAEIRKVARDTTNLSQDLAEGFDVLAGLGASEGDALGMLPAIGKAAVAYRAEITDLSNAGYAALDNLNVPADQFARTLDVMAQAGKAGAFELKDMATYFPQLGAAYQGLKQQGVPAVADLAAALQIVRKGTGDAASAATNLGNVLQKIQAPATVKKFAEMGVNLERELKEAAERGLTPIEAIAEITNRALKGDLGKLGYLFEDSQVQAGLRPLIQNIELYRKIRADALKAQGVVEADYQERLKTGAMAGQRFAVAMESINIAVGSALMPALADLAGAIVPIATSFAKFAEENPGLTRTLIGTAAAVVGLNVAVTAARFGGLFLFGGLLKAAKGAALAGQAVARLTGFLGSLLRVGKVVETALPASLEGFSRASQAVTRNSRVAADASRRMVDGMSAARRASDQMIAGMSSSASRASVTGFETFGRRAAGGILGGMRGVLAAGNLAALVSEMLADLDRTAEERLQQMRENGESWRKLETGLDESWAGRKWRQLQEVFHGPKEPNAGEAAPASGNSAPAEPARPQGPSPSYAVDPVGPVSPSEGRAPEVTSPASVPLPLPRPAELRKLDEIAAAAQSAFAKITPALAGERPKVEAAAEAIRDRVESILSPMIEIPVGVGLGGMGNRLRPAPTAWEAAPPPIAPGRGSHDIGAPPLDGARASGGPVEAGKTYLVGERGREIFQPASNGTIFPNRVVRELERPAERPAQRPATERQKGGASVTVNIGTVHLGAGAPQSAAADFAAELERRLARSSQVAFSSTRYEGA
ncbi:phage tail tape measure protein [Ancylobacter sp. SL191]|uniref:phage tail tape measure protein n=1 Tax=Ancylobacter sp. SL191 TaxID=2995166 RepID=UPI00227034EE|nr:phage tail tape measure protein [Ancylobacter sp. SL191]WAC26265.1 phage tail tape measure protein [Ancylobacter sp. SL191]